jgi:hypothetical protein
VLNTTASTPFSGTVTVTMYVTIGPTTYIGTPLYCHDSSGNTRQLITLDFAIGSIVTPPAVVSSVTVIATTN